MQPPSAPAIDARPQPIRTEHLRNPPGEGNCYFADSHSLFISLASRPVRYLHAQDGKTLAGVFRPGDMLITPAQTSLFTRWEDDEDCLHVRLTTEFLHAIARETFADKGDRLQLVPQCQFRNPQLEAIAMMLLAETQQDVPTSQLYLDSLANVLAVNLLRHHATTQPQLPAYEGGLPPRQLQRVLEYIDAHLDRKIELEALAKLLGMSQFHFSRLFKQSLGTSPYRYAIQQRVERAKQLLKHSDLTIIEIALDCGFSSHGHLSRQFRQVTGMTPKAFRKS